MPVSVDVKHHHVYFKGLLTKLLVDVKQHTTHTLSDTGTDTDLEHRPLRREKNYSLFCIYEIEFFFFFVHHTVRRVLNIWYYCPKDVLNCG